MARFRWLLWWSVLTVCAHESYAATHRRTLKDLAGTNSAQTTFPAFSLPNSNLQSVPVPPVTAAKSDNLVFSNTLPASAVNLGLGANAFPGEASQKDDLISVVGKNITLFLQEMFGGKCPLPGSYCQDISDAFWKKLVDDLTSSSQSIADPTMIDKMVSALNGIFYIFQPKGLTAAPPDLVTKIVDATPSPTPDPTSVIVSKISSITTDVSGALQKLTGFAPPPGGLSQVLEHFFGNTPTIDGAAAAAAGAAGGR